MAGGRPNPNRTAGTGQLPANRRSRGGRGGRGGRAAPKPKATSNNDRGGSGSRNASGGVDPYKYDTSRRAPHARGAAGSVYKGPGTHGSVTAGAAPAEAAAPTNYDALFRASLDKSRANIDSQFRSTIAAIGARQGEFNSLVARQPGEVNAAFDRAKPQMDAAAAESANTFRALNVAALPGVAQNAGMEPQLAGLEFGRAANLADQPYLQAGVTDLIARQKGAAEQGRMQAQADVDNQQAEYYGQAANTQAAAKAEQDNTIKNMQAQASINDYFQRSAEKRQGQAATAAEQKALSQNEPPRGTAEWWAWNQQKNPDAARAFGNNAPGAQYAAQNIGKQTEKDKFLGVFGGGTTTTTVKDMLKKYKGPKYARLRSWIRYQYGK